MFSKACQYGIKAVIYIGYESQLGNRVSLRAVAKEIKSPVAFTGKILQLLAKENIIVSVKGAKGGYEIPANYFDRWKLGDIVHAIDGEQFYNNCILGLDKCSHSNPCPAHHKYVHIKKELKHMLDSTKLKDLVHGVLDGTSILKI